MKRVINIVLLIGLAWGVKGQEYDEPEYDPIRQYISWGLVLDGNVDSWIHHIEGVEVGNRTLESIKATPFIGSSFGLFIEYHISQRWSIKLAELGGIENVRLRFSDEMGYTHRLTQVTYGLETEFSVRYRHALGHGKAVVEAGPYSNYVLGSYLGNGANDPYSQEVTDDSEGNLFALTAFHSGFYVSIGYEIEDHLHLALYYKQGLNDILNFMTDGSFAYPYKIGLCGSYYF